MRRVEKDRVTKGDAQKLINDQIYSHFHSHRKVVTLKQQNKTAAYDFVNNKNGLSQRLVLSFADTKVLKSCYVLL